MLLVSRQDQRHGFGMNRRDYRVCLGGQETVDQMRPGNGLRLGAPVSLELCPDATECEQRPLVIFSANQTTSIFLVSGFGSGAYSAKLLAGTRQRLSGFSQPRQCGDDLLRMLVTGSPPVLGGGGMPQRIKTNSLSSPELRTTGAG